MELKDLVLSTLAELDEKLHTEDVKTEQGDAESVPEVRKGQKPYILSEEERRFLLHTRERLCVLFEGLQQEEGNQQAKLEMTLKFLQYYLGLIEERLSSSEH